MLFDKYIIIIVRACIMVCIYHENTSHGNDGYVKPYTGNGILFSWIPEEIPNAKNYEFTAAKSTKTFLGFTDNHRKDFDTILDKVSSFKNKRYNLLTHNCQHFCQHIESILSRS